MSVETTWAVAGLLLIIADVVFGTFYMLFIGAAALITALLVWLKVLPNESVQWLVFAVISIASVILFRKKLVTAFGKDGADKYVEHAGQKVNVLEAIPAHGIGKVTYKGSQWQAKTQDGTALEANSQAEIVTMDGIILIVKADS